MANRGYGITLGSNNSNWSTLGNIRNISVEGATRTQIDTSDGSNATDDKTFIPGMRDPGAISFELTYVKANATKVKNAFTSTGETWTVTFPDASTWACSGFVSDYGFASAGVDDLITQSATIKCSGPSTFTPSTT